MSGGPQPKLVAKHKLVMVESGQKQVHICDVCTWDDSGQVEHGISGMLQVTRRYTPSKAISHFPKFRLTLSARADDAQVLPFLDKLRRNRQAAVVVLNNCGWVGYLLPHETNPKLYCHFHYQKQLDASRQKVRSHQQPKMSRLAIIQHGPWASPTYNRGGGGLIDGPDYDPALVYSMDDLDPYRGMPPPRDDEPLVPSCDAVAEDTEMAAILSGVRERQAETSSVRRDRGQGQGGQAAAGRREGGRGSAQDEAARKYGEVLRTEGQQASSFIYHLKRFNNWVKSTLISKASKDSASSGLRVLDLACGKGGDLGKWAAHPDGIEKYVGSDIAFGSLQHLVERMAKSAEKGSRVNWRKVPVKLFEADLGSNDVQRDRVRVWENSGGTPGEWDDRVPLNEGDLFDVASMQFALHYMGQSEARMRRFMHEVSRHLRIGGVFIATTMDSRVLIQLLMGQAEQSWDTALSRNTLKVEFEDERKHNLLSIAFKDPYESYIRQHSEDGDYVGPFGLEYTFTLRETELNKNAVDEVPEWMLPLDALKDVAADYGLELETAQNFHEFYAQESQADPARMNLRNMHVFNPQGSMNTTEWRIAGIYMALVFRKTSTAMRSVGVLAPASPPSPSSPAPRQHPPASPTAPPPGWEGPRPKFQPTSPDHPPPNLPTGDFMDVRPNSASVPRSPQHPPPEDVEFAPRSPTSPPPPSPDADSDDDTMYNNALVEARSAVPPEEWDAFPPAKKQACIEAQMRLLT